MKERKEIAMLLAMYGIFTLAIGLIGYFIVSLITSSTYGWEYLRGYILVTAILTPFAIYHMVK